MMEGTEEWSTDSVHAKLGTQAKFRPQYALFIPVNVNLQNAYCFSFFF
jgi:hypothetical protein